MDSGARIGLLQGALEDLRKTYLTIKSELSALERRRKKIRKKKEQRSNTTELHSQNWLIMCCEKREWGLGGWKLSKDHVTPYLAKKNQNASLKIISNFFCGFNTVIYGNCYIFG